MTRTLSTLLLILTLLVQGHAQSQVLISTKSAKKDFETLIRKIESVHFNPYFKNSKNSVNELKETIFTKWNKDSIPLKEFIGEGMKITALMSGGHTYLDWQNSLLFEELSSYKFIPLTGKLDLNSKFFSITSVKSNKINKQAKIKYINGIRVEELFNECTNYIGGIQAFKNANCELLFPLYLFFNNRIKAPYKFELDDGTIVLEKGIDINELTDMLSSISTNTSNYYEILQNKICVLSYNSCENPKEFKKLLKKMFKTIKENKINHLLIDIRHNSGGNSYLNEMLLSYITTTPYRQSSGRYWKVSALAKEHYSNSKAHRKNMGRKLLKKYLATNNGEVISELNYELISPKKNRLFFSGETRLLIGPKTFSSANFLADAMKTYNIGILIGSETGENTNDFGEMISFQLENSGCWVSVSSTYDIGCSANKDLYQPVEPDVFLDADRSREVIIQELITN